MEERRILLSQTAPAMAPDDLGKRLLLTYLNHDAGTPTRHPLRVRLAGFGKIFQEGRTRIRNRIR